jgi:hypothetical protein
MSSDSSVDGTDSSYAEPAAQDRALDEGKSTMSCQTGSNRILFFRKSDASGRRFHRGARWGFGVRQEVTR